MLYLQVFWHTRQHLIQVKILDQSEPVAYSYKIGTGFFFLFFLYVLKNFAFFFFDLLMCYLQVFMQKRRYWIHVRILIQSEPGAFSYKIVTSIFFFLFFLRNFAFFCWTSSCAIFEFSYKNVDIIFRSKFLTNLSEWRFHTKLIEFFFFISF